MTTTIDLAARIEQIVAAKDFGQASARKSGRNPAWPYVPVVIHTDECGRRSVINPVRGLAYATRAEAVERAERSIAFWRADLAEKLANPRHRAQRESYGLPREIS